LHPFGGYLPRIMTVPVWVLALPEFPLRWGKDIP